MGHVFVPRFFRLWWVVFVSMRGLLVVPCLSLFFFLFLLLFFIIFSLL